jgi:hypothetical protein
LFRGSRRNRHCISLVKHSRLTSWRWGTNVRGIPGRINPATARLKIRPPRAIHRSRTLATFATRRDEARSSTRDDALRARLQRRARRPFQWRSLLDSASFPTFVVVRVCGPKPVVEKAAGGDGIVSGAPIGEPGRQKSDMACILPFLARRQQAACDQRNFSRQL